MHTDLRVLATAASALLALGGVAEARTIYVSNEKGNTISIVDGDTLELVQEVAVGERPRGIALSPDDKFLYICASDDDTVQILDTETLEIVGTLPSGPDPEVIVVSPDGATLYAANEDDNLVTVVDIARREMVSEIPVGVEPEGMAVSPDGSTIVNTSETTNMAHFIDATSHEITHNVLVDQRPRVAEFTADGAEVWVSAEIGGTVSVIDNATREVKHKITFAIPGVPDEAIQPVGVRVTSDRSRAFVALGPANRVAVVDAQSYEVEDYLLVGQRVWQLAFSPDEKFALLDQRRLQRHLGDRRRGREGDQVGRGRQLPVGRRGQGLNRRRTRIRAPASKATRGGISLIESSSVRRRPRGRARVAVPGEAQAQAGLLTGGATELEPITLSSASRWRSAPYELEAGKYYRIDIEADGSAELALTGPEFFRNVWVDEVIINDIEVRPLGLDSLEFDDEGTATISFVTIRPGSFALRIPGTTGRSPAGDVQRQVAPDAPGNVTRTMLLAAARRAAARAAGAAATGADPDWPCVQRLVPEIAAAMIWTGPPLEQRRRRGGDRPSSWRASWRRGGCRWRTPRRRSTPSPRPSRRSRRTRS